MDPSSNWVSWIADHRQDRSPASRHLLDACQRGVRGVARRYPSVYFELGSRTEEAMASLVHRVFTDLDGRTIGRFPFSERTPFDCYLQERMADRQARYHSFSARLSVTREALRAQYSHNVRRHPAWLAREELHRAVVAVLRAECAPFAGRRDGYPRYGLHAWPDGHRAARADWDPDAVVGALRRRGGWSVSARVQIVLSKRGAPMYPGEISRLLQDAAIEPTAFDAAEPAATTPEVTDAVAVRGAAAAAFAELDGTERRLLVLLLAGRPYREIPDELPDLRNPVAVTRALQAICDKLLGRVLAAVGVKRAAAASLRPKEAAELLLGVLVTVPGIRAELMAEEGTAP